MSEYFSILKCSSIKDFKKNSHIHVIGICGVAMAQIAIELKKAGFHISGSDREFYEPMSGLLNSHNLDLYKGYSSDNISDKVDLVLIGNSVSRDNPEVTETEARKLPYTIFPKILNELVIADKKSIVVAGTHGKSTTSAMAAWCMFNSNLQPSYFIGGVVRSMPTSLSAGEGAISVVEGDEYDSAFFAKVPKFKFYRADCLIITSIEFDHADIYNNIHEIISVFNQAIDLVPKNGCIIACIDNKIVKSLVDTWKNKANVITYGFDTIADFIITERSFANGQQKINIKAKDTNFSIGPVNAIGAHNASNALGVWIATNFLGVEQEKIDAGLSNFQGVKRRQEIRLKNNSVTLIEDFAHHPTAVRLTLEAIKESYPGHRIVCLFEPRSNSSRRKVFEDDYIQSFLPADLILLKSVTARHNDAGIELIDIASMSNEISKLNKVCYSFSDVEEGLNLVANNFQSNDVVVVMSNGSFDGIIEKLINYFQSIS
jgi:UDP-N-acetylmuramate: L-alanyl-gamma-D-glutamyl-meso-diaminopimelate ligase